MRPAATTVVLAGGAREGCATSLLLISFDCRLSVRFLTDPVVTPFLPILRHRDCNSARFHHVVTEIGHPEGCPEGMGVGSSPAQRMARLFSSSRGRHSDPDKVAAGPNQAPRGPAAIPTRSKVANKPKGEPSRKIPASVSPG